MVPGDGLKPQAGFSALMRQPLARRDQDLMLDNVHAGHQLGDRMLDLHAGIHLHEVEVSVLVQQEFDGAGVVVTDGLRRVDRGLAHLAAKLRRHDGAW